MERVIRLSQIEEDVAVIVGSFASPIKDQVYTHMIRGVVVSKMPHWVRREKGHEYVLCVFPDHTQQWVRQDNIRSFKLGQRKEVIHDRKAA